MTLTKNAKYLIPVLAAALLIPLGISAQMTPGGQDAQGQDVSDAGIPNADQARAEEMQAAGDTQNIPVDEIKQEFKADIRELLLYADDETFDARADELRSEHDEFFRVAIEQIRVASGTRELTSEEIAGAINYIVYETIKDEKRKIREQAALSSNNITWNRIMDTPDTNASLPKVSVP